MLPFGGFSVLRAVVALGVIVALLMVLYAFIADLLVKNQMTSTLSNMRQLHLATQTVAEDGVATRDPRLVWPGDDGGSYSIGWRLWCPIT